VLCCWTSVWTESPATGWSRCGVDPGQPAGDPNTGFSSADGGFGIGIEVGIGGTVAAAATEWFMKATKRLNSSSALAYIQ